METLEDYLLRKNEECKLLNGLLENPFKLRQPRSVDEVIEQKFHLAAALKAEHDLQDWALTETAWTHSGRPRSSAFELDTTTNVPTSKSAVHLSTLSRNWQTPSPSIRHRGWRPFRRC
jgi:hypothetical protein